MPVPFPAAPAPQSLWADHVAARQAVVRAASTPGVTDEGSRTLTARERSALRAQLWAAIKANDAPGVRAALEAGADPSQFKVGDGLKTPPLFAAVTAQNLDMIEHLLEAGADPNQKNAMNVSIGGTVVQADDPVIAERLIAAGLRIGDPKVDTAMADRSHHHLVPYLFYQAGPYGAVRLKTWWLERGGEGLPGTTGATLPLTPPADGHTLTTTQRDDVQRSVWGRWTHTAANLKDAPLARALRERVMGWSTLEAAGRDPRDVWSALLEGPWNDAILEDDTERLDWLVAQRWTPPTLLNEHGIAWSWTALTSNATNAYAWLIAVPGMAERMREDVRHHPELTLHRPLENAHKNQARFAFTGWTQPMLNRLVRAGVDVGAPNAQGDHLFHTLLFNDKREVSAVVSPRAAANDTLVTWLSRFRPDLISVPNHEGLDVLALGDRWFGLRADWLPQRARMEQAVLRGMAETPVDEPVEAPRPRRRL